MEVITSGANPKLQDCVICSGWAQYRSSPTIAKLLSSAARGSLITILLLLPVFFLQSASRPRITKLKAKSCLVTVNSIFHFITDK